VQQTEQSLLSLLVGERQKIVRDFDAERLRDGEVEFGWQHDGGGRRAFHP